MLMLMATCLFDLDTGGMVPEDAPDGKLELAEAEAQTPSSLHQMNAHQSNDENGQEVAHLTV